MPLESPQAAQAAFDAAAQAAETAMARARFERNSQNLRRLTEVLHALEHANKVLIKAMEAQLRDG